MSNSGLESALRDASIIEYDGHRFHATESLLARLTAAVSLGDGLGILTSDDETPSVRFSLPAGEARSVLRLCHDALDQMCRIQAEIDGTEQRKVFDRTPTDHGLFETEDVIDVELPEALQKYAEPGETPEETKARLSERWFDLNQRFIALSRGEQWPERLTEAEHKLMNELSIFARG